MKGWISSRDIEAWTVKEPRRAQEILPELIDRLIHASDIEIQEARFPYGEDINSTGYDGFLNATGMPPFIPEGISVWEMGTNKDYKRKWNDDYKKRTEETELEHPVMKKDTTFCFVSTRSIGAAEMKKWCEKKKQDGVWKDVKAYDANVLAEWMAQYSAVLCWFARVVGKPLDGIWDAEGYWHHQLANLPNPLTTKFFTCGREPLWPQIDQKKKAGEQTVALIGECRQEILLLLAAEILEMENPLVNKAYSGSLFVETNEAIRYCSDEKKRTLILTQEYPDIRIGKGCFYVLVLDKDTPLAGRYLRQGNYIEVSKRTKQLFFRALTTQGYDGNEADFLTDQLRQRFPALLRRLTNNPAQMLPASLSRENINRLVPALLLQRWDTSYTGDREVIEYLTGDSAEAYCEAIKEFLHGDDAVFTCFNTVYTGIDLPAIWSEYGKEIPDTMYGKFFTSVRWILTGKSDNTALCCSKQLIRGVADTLVSIRYIRNLWKEQREWILRDSRRTVREVLEQIVTREQWERIAFVLPLLAEAAPEACLYALEGYEMFPDASVWKIDKGDLTDTISRFLWERSQIRRVINLLIILGEQHEDETAAWAVQLLARSFWPWVPQGAFSEEERKILSLEIIEHHPVIRREFVAAAFIRWTPPAVEIQRSLRQPLSMDDRELSIKDIRDVRTRAVRSYLEVIQPCAADWGIFFQEISSDMLTGEVLQTLEKQIHEMSEIDRLKLGRSVAHYVSWQRRFPDASWRMEDDILTQMELLLEHLLPDSPLSFVHCFDEDYRGVRPFAIKQTPDFAQKQRAFWDEQLQCMVRKYGEEAVYVVAPKVRNKNAFAQALLDVLMKSFDESLLCRLRQADEVCADTLISLWYYQRDWDVCRRKMNSLTKEVRGEVLAALPLDETIVIYVNECPVDEQDYFWEHVKLYNYPLRTEHLMDLCLKPLLAHHRAIDIIRCFCFLQVRNSLPIVQTILAAVEEDKAFAQRVSREAVEDLFDALYANDDISDAQLAQLEWICLPAMSALFVPQALIRHVLRVPAFYLRLLSIAWPNETGQFLSEESSEAKHRAVSVLCRIRRIPGWNEQENVLNEKSLQDWIRSAEVLAKNFGYEEVHHAWLGRILAYTPCCSAEEWPLACIRNLLENQPDRVIFNMAITKSTLRGAHGATAGKKERQLAECYQQAAEAQSVLYPKTAKMLDTIAKEYREEARFDERREGEDF